MKPARTTCPSEIPKWTDPAFLKEMRWRQTERELDELTMTPFVPYYVREEVHG